MSSLKIYFSIVIHRRTFFTFQRFRIYKEVPTGTFGARIGHAVCGTYLHSLPLSLNCQVRYTGDEETSRTYPPEVPRLEPGVKSLRG